MKIAIQDVLQNIYDMNRLYELMNESYADSECIWMIGSHILDYLEAYHAAILDTKDKADYKLLGKRIVIDEREKDTIRLMVVGSKTDYSEDEIELMTYDEWKERQNEETN